eukprot:TRINITY_DN42874_c0_g1_i1.p1 TRINITY_DN42874_c0_g1~~TRINITY_DN42874_c0_g1_i1.p1  ORF type:complete len:766 (-),score=124.12 TRINITY_DN42874_c0_g1_i1:414-2654(-)
MVKTIAPPDIGDLIVLKVDAATHHVQFDQQPLQLVLRKYREYIRDLHERGVADMQSDVSSQMQSTKREMVVLLNEKTQAIDSRIDSKLDEVLELSETATNTLRQFEVRIDKLSDRVQNAEDMAVMATKNVGSLALPNVPQDGKDSHRSKPPPPTPPKQQSHNPSRRNSWASVTSVQSAARFVNVLVDDTKSRRSHSSFDYAGGPVPGTMDDLSDLAEEIDAAKSENGGEGNSENIQEIVDGDVAPHEVSYDDEHSRRSQQLGLSRQDMIAMVQEQILHFSKTEGVTRDDLEDLARLSKVESLAADTRALAIDITLLKEQLTVLQQNTQTIKDTHDNYVAEMKSERIRIDDAMSACMSDIGINRRLIEANGRNIDEQTASTKELTGRLESLDLNKVDVMRFEKASADIEQIQFRLGGLAIAATIEERIMRIERNTATAKTMLQKATTDTSVFAKQMEELNVQTKMEVQRSLEANRALETVIEDHSVSMEDQRLELKRIASRLEGSVKDVRGLSSAIMEKAPQSELDMVKHALSGLSQCMKDKDQAVLFGARCLSCNHVLDDAQQDAGIVDIHADKQRAHLYAEVQRALQNPKSDPTKPIKMIAVRVGRPSPISGDVGGSRPGHYYGRDGVSLACGVEDVQLMPALGTNASLLGEASKRGSGVCPSRTGTAGRLLVGASSTTGSTGNRNVLKETPRRSPRPLTTESTWDRVKRGATSDDPPAPPVDGHSDFKYGVAHLVDRNPEGTKG